VSDDLTKTSTNTKTKEKRRAMKTQSSLFSSLIMLGAVMLQGVACSSGNGERHASTEQPIETTPDAGDGDASADDGSASATDPDAAPANTCTHSLCATGESLTASCDPCATTLCAADPYCCAAAWDATCVGEVASVCNQSCTAPPAAVDAGPTTCPHALCATGVALPSSCDACAAQLCAQDIYCCTAAWDATCVGEVSSICGQTCQ